MNIDMTSLSAATRDVSAMLRTRQHSDIILFLAIFLVTLCLTPVIVLGGWVIGFSYVLAILVALLFALIIIRWPVVGLFIIVGCALVIEQDPILVGNLTLYVYVFYWPTRLQGLVDRPIGFLFFFILLVLVCHNLVRRQKVLQGGKLILPFLFFILCVAMGIVHGLTSGGDFRIMVLEIRSFEYLFLSYILAYNLFTRFEHVRLFFWFVIFGAGLKGLQGTYVYLIVLHGKLDNINQIMPHEDSFFFAALLLLIVLFILHHAYRPQLIAALIVSPFVVIALVGNERRADYAALLIGIGIAWVLIFLVKPQYRKRLIIILVTTLLLGGAYVLAFAHASGTIAKPAQSIISIFSPTVGSRDYLSNLYRYIEDADLKFTVKQSPLIGWGFGKPFLQPVPLPNIITLDPYYLYIPHNTIYWVWMRMGAIGYGAFWFLIGAIVVRGCFIARQLRNPYLQLVAIFVVAIVFMEIAVAYADYQFYFYRNVIYLGLLVGMLLKLPSMDKEEKAPAHASTRRFAESPVTSGRS